MSDNSEQFNSRLREIKGAITRVQSEISTADDERIQQLAALAAISGAAVIPHSEKVLPGPMLFLPEAMYRRMKELVPEKFGNDQLRKLGVEA